jgi:transposase
LLKTYENYFKKKTTLYRERDAAKRKEFIEAISVVPRYAIAYVDEAGVDNRLFYEYARAPRGTKVYADIPGRKRERISMIGSLLNGKFIAPMTFNGGCDTDMFNTWLEEILLPTLPQNSMIVLDNAAFHKSSKTVELITKAKCRLMFLPTYSPDLNPIENCWHTLKSRLRPLIQKGCDNLENLVGDHLVRL